MPPVAALWRRRQRKGVGISIVEVVARSLTPFAELYGRSELQRVEESAGKLRERRGGGVIWNINSTARGGGVAELLQSVVA